MNSIQKNELSIEFISYRNKGYTIRDYLQALESIGIRKGDTICVHSQVFGFGYPLCEERLLMEYFCRILMDSVGQRGTLIMPTFSYSFCRGEDYNIKETPSTVGVLTEYFRNIDETKRTSHPIFSFSVLGKREDEFLNCGWDAFDAKNSVYGKMLQSNDSIVLFGAPKGYTFYYLSEQSVGVSHRFIKKFTGNIINEDRKREISIPYYVRKLDRNSAEDEKKVDEFLQQENLLKVVKVGGGSIRKGNCRDIFDACSKKIREKEDYFLKNSFY